MKANKSPEKIYIHPDICGSGVLAEWMERPLGKQSVEYIRSDAFIEKAIDYIANNMRCDGYTLQTKAKFIKDFKKYMEG